jgi:mannitol-1-/sugar-/sorbitol-6-/2-deoxyglucose-6-phosphatase
MKMIKAAIFDMDGLLIDSMPLWKEAIKKAVLDAGSTFTEDMWNSSKGKRADEIINYWHDLSPWKGKSVAAVEKEAVNHALELIMERGEPMEGVGHVLRYARKKNAALAMASSSPQSIMDAVVEKLELDDFFDIVYSAEHVERGKPHPGVYIAAAEKLGIPSYSCLVFEDSLVGLIAAKAAGMKCVAVPSADYKDDPRMILADLVISSLADFGDADWNLLRKL